MQFDNFGNLYINVGDNEAEANGPANTADLRGGILRIHPDASIAKGYTIPAGNFGDYWAQQWQNQGLAARATAYRDTAIVKPEIYIKGSRNPYGSGTDKNRLGWIAWSECGPDIQRAEEYNITSHPAFSGWPFWHGNAVKQLSFANEYNETPEPITPTLWALFNPASNLPAVPVNNWSNANGYDTLPLMHMPIYQPEISCSQGGTIIRYDGSINNTGKMPPHLDNTVMFTEVGGPGDVYGVKYDTVTGAKVGTVVKVFTSLSRSSSAPNLGNSLDFQQGPDGALYSVNWGEGCCNGDRGGLASEGIARITYTGTCQDPGLIPVAVQNPIIRTDVNWLQMGANSFSVSTTGPHEIQIMNSQGRVLSSFKGEGGREYKMPANLPQAAVYFLQAKTNQGTAIRGFLRP
jgi:hypothetical protein